MRTAGRADRGSRGPVRPTFAPMHWHHAAFARAWLVAVAMGGCGLLAAQGRKHFTAFDTAYVADYSRILTTRAYISTKFNRLVLGGLQEARDLEYRPNNRVNFGLGASYHALTLNIGVGIPGVNNNQDKYGTTRYLDAQANIHTRRWATNLFLQGFRGYYISSHTKQELGWVQATTYPTRPDLRQFNVGVSTVHIFNNGRFSYRAAFNQDAWQRRSQGSFLVGGYLTYFNLRADSSLVPAALAASFRADQHLRKGEFIDLGPSAGYAYTLVVHEHWFITGSAVAGVGISAQRTAVVEPDGRTEHKSYTGPGWHGQFRAGAGYNSARYYVGLSFNQENIGYLLEDRGNLSWAVGNIRFNVAKRFSIHLDHKRGIRGPGTTGGR